MKNFYLKHKKSCITAIIFVSLVIFYTLFGFFVVPWLLTDVAPKFVADKNATLSIKEAKFHPYKFELNATKINLKTYSDIFSADGLDVSLNFKELFSRNINVDIFRLTNPFVNIEREKDLSFNFSPLVKSDENATQEPQENEKDSFFNFTLNSFEIIKGDAKYADMSLSRPFIVSFKDLSYTIKDINLKEYSVGKHELDTDSSLLDKFDWNGGISLNPLTIYGDIEFSGLNTAQIWQSYMSASDLNVTKGELDARLKYKLSVDQNGISARLDEANLKAREFEINDKNGSAKFADFELKDIAFSGNFGDKNVANGEIKEISLNELLFKSKLEAEFKKFNIVGLNYALDSEFSANFSELGLFDLALKSDGDNASLKELSLKELGAKFDINSKDFSLNIPGLNLNAFAFKNADASVTNENFYMTDITLNAKEDFKNIALALPEFGLKGIKFSGFDIDLAQPEFKFNGLNLALNNENNASKINADLDSFNASPTEISGAKEKLAHINAMNAGALKFSDENLTLSSFKIGKTDVFSKNKIFAGLSEIALENLEFNLKTSALNLKNIKVIAPFFNDEIDNNGAKALNNLAILKKISSDKQPKTKPKKEGAKTNQNAFAANIENFEITNATSNISQSFLSGPLNHKITLKNAKITGFSTDFTKPFDISMEASTGEKIGLNLKGKAALEPMKAEFDAKINATDLKELNKIAKDFIDAEISGGKLGIDAKFKLDKSYALNAAVKLDEFGLNDGNKTRILTVKNTNVKNIALNEKELKIDGVSVNSPYLRAHLNKDKSLNLAKIVKTNDANQTETNATAATTIKNEEKALKIQIKNVAINDTSVDFSDESLVLPFLFKIRNLNANLDNIEQGAISDISSNGTIGSGGSANIAMRLDALNPKAFSDIALKFKDVELNEATPYSATFVGRKIDSGTIDLSLVYKIEESQMKGDNEVRIDTIKLGESVESPDAMSLPLQLAISILQDSNNVIKLNLPVSGDLQNPQFSYGGIVLQAIMQIFTDVVTSPFRLIGNVLGVGNTEELAKIDFTAGNDDVIESQGKKIDEFKKITDAKKDMRIIITPAYDEVVDKFAVQKRLFDRDVATAANKRGVSQHEIIREMATKQFKNPPSEPHNALIELKKIDADTLENLAKDRAENLKSAMIKAGISADQIRVADKIERTKAQMELYVPLPMGIENR